MHVGGKGERKGAKKKGWCRCDRQLSSIITITKTKVFFMGLVYHQKKPWADNNTVILPPSKEPV